MVGREGSAMGEVGDIALKIQGPGGACVIRGLTADTPMSELRRSAAAVLKASPERLRLLTGRPPRALSTAPGVSLRDVGIASGDTLLAEEAPLPPMPEVPPLPPYGGSQDRPGYLGLLLKRVVPSDNSCLFTSIGFVMNGKVDTSLAPYMRKIIADVVANDPINYCDAFLGKANPDYCEWIQRSDSWGGAIEISILSTLYGLEIDVVNVLNAVVNRFGEDKEYGQRVFLMFDGIHYDPLFSEKEGGGIQTIFPIEEVDMLHDAEQLAKSAQPYTDVDKIRTKCLICGTILIGQKSANQHAKETSHTEFDEI